MSKPFGLAAAAAIAFAAAGLALAPVRGAADTIVYSYVALPGDAPGCAWFDDHINDRTLDAMIRQTDALYNRTALAPGEPVTISGNATTALGANEVQFTIGKRLLCANEEIIHPNALQASPAPQPT